MLADNQGSVRDVVELNGGTTVTHDHLAYDAYGKLSQTDSSYAPTFSYTGRQYDAAADLYYCRAQWYDAGTGGFISEDPLGFGGGDANLARYCGNSPTNFTDPAEDRTKNGANVVGSE